MVNVRPGWYPDPDHSNQLRWWTGEAWTGATMPRPQNNPPAARKGLSVMGVIGVTIGSIFGFCLLMMVIGFAVAGVNGSGSTAATGGGVSSASPHAESGAQPAPAAPPAKTAAEMRDESQEAAGWSVIQSGSLYGKFAAKEEYTCGYTACTYYYVLTVTGCPSALYVEGSTLSSGVVVGMTNDLLSGVRAGEIAAAHLQILEDGADSVRINTVDCY
ncbi:DUF2510 domain-containing protein [Microbacterium sp. KSW2-21]|uniref:DUF2510 domain-containing protein n=1 Tax=Microbacterium algihabitans TaxID=3075992 RepID=A0ABU3RR54_9MICO|nr:DUF2510 domain-containing protein [Microbacterium sp. KSW2-21]MDU0325293.1 DUF2510 domain-containing protein [Microbacterium sp. KSW2-21]